MLLDGLQASGRVDEALALTESAMTEARALGNPYFIAYAYWTAGGAWSVGDQARAMEVWREGLDYVQQHHVDLFSGFIARDAARLRLLDADPDNALVMFDAAIDAFHRAGNVAQLTITLASTEHLLEDRHIHPCRGHAVGSRTRCDRLIERRFLGAARIMRSTASVPDLHWRRHGPTDGLAATAPTATQNELRPTRRDDLLLPVMNVTVSPPCSVCSSSPPAWSPSRGS